MKSGEQRTAANQTPAGVQCENKDVSRLSITLDEMWAQHGIPPPKASGHEKASPNATARGRAAALGGARRWFGR